MKPLTRARFIAGLATMAAVVGGLGWSVPAAQADAGPNFGRQAVATPSDPGYVAVQPKRLLDTRSSTTVHRLGQAGTATIKVTGVADVPTSGVAAVVLNITGITQAPSSYLTVFPAGAVRPTASNLNLAKAQPRANQVFVTVGTGGAITVFNAVGSTDVLVDISGYFRTGSTYSGQSPVRILDTRHDGGPIGPAGTRTLQVSGHGNVPAGVSSVVVNLTGISTLASTFVTAYPAGSPRPATSNLNLAAGQTAAVLAVVQLDAAGQVTFYGSGGPTQLVVDVAGWFSGTGDYTPVTPTRLLDSRITAGYGYGNDVALQVSGRGGVPTDAGAAVLSVTAVTPTNRGYLTLHPYGGFLPRTSNVNVEAHATTPNLVVAQMSADGAVSIYNGAPGGSVLVDVVGWLATNQAVGFSPVTAPVGQVGQPFHLALSAFSGRAPYTWSIGAGHLPAGLTLSASAGVVSGTPTTSGTAGVLLVATDGTGGAAAQPLSLRTAPFVPGAVWGWGPSWLILSTIPSTAVTSPTAVVAQSQVVEMATSRSVAFARHSDGTVWSWGDRDYLGSNATHPARASDPQRVGALTGIAAIAAGGNAAYALRSDGTVWSWGLGVNGALGNGGTANAPLPVQVSGLTGVTAIAGSFSNAYALRSDGTLWAWGSGLPTTAGTGGRTSTTPVQVTGLPPIVAVGTGAYNGYAVASDGSAWAWGSDSNGQLGPSTTTASRAPVQVSGLSDVVQVTGGWATAFARTRNGQVWAWGADTDGELGDGGHIDSATPALVPHLDAVTQVNAGANAGLAVRADGTLWQWGNGSGGPSQMAVPWARSAVASPWGFTYFSVDAR